MVTNVLSLRSRSFSLRLCLILFLTISFNANAQVPVITVQPTSVSVCEPIVISPNVTFTVTATGATSYQWRKDGVAIVGATSPSYNIPAVVSVNLGTYTVAVTNASGTTVSDYAFLGNFWNGNLSTTWGDGLNWSCGITPFSTTSANIPTGAPRYPILNTVIRPCRSLNIGAGATVTITGTGAVEIYGNINKRGTLNAIDGSVRMYGTAAQTIPANTFVSNTIKNLVINNTNGVTLVGDLSLTGVLAPTAGTFTTGGFLTLKCNASTTAMIDVVSGVVSGEITVERYISARRAFRFVTSSVTSTGSIYTNWQENGANTSGFGTDITGVGGATNGFDPSGSNNPSLFTHAHNNSLSGTWNAVTSTTTGVLTAGVPYRILVRGDRTIDQTNNNATPNVTVLRAKGTILSGDIPVANLNTAIGGYTLLGNPYQARLNMFDALAGSSTGLNAQYYYVWDPTRNTRGAYVTVDVISNLNNVVGSTANRLVPPGQAFYVLTAGATPTLTFRELQKQVLTTATQAIWRNSNVATAQMRFTLYEDGALAQNGASTDGFVVRFNEDYSNAINGSDALKPVNQDENIGLMNAGKIYSFESRNLPTVADVLPISHTQYRNTNYTYKVEVDGIAGVNAYLLDKYTNTRTELVNGTETSISFAVDSTIPASSAENRFDVVFGTTLGNEESAFAKSVKVYPNPVVGNQFFVQLPTDSEGSVTVRLTNLLGQEVYTSSLEATGNTVKIEPAMTLQSGIYIVSISNGKATTTKKLIVK